MPYWIDKIKLKKSLAIIDRNEFGDKNTIGEFKYVKIKDLINCIRNKQLLK